MNQGNGMGREAGGGSGWGTHVHPWWIHVNVWQNQYNIPKVISLQLKKKKNKLGSFFHIVICAACVL